ncbi:MAG: tRNA pseudouridine(55) synthase TruB [Mariprofundaceae bacterium]
MNLSGVVFLDKPLGWTSRKAVNEVMRLLSTPGQKRIKAGHTGTLDPLATGMLPILLGEGTKFSEFGLNAQKSYSVTFDLSYQTDTLDCEGEVSSRFDQTIDEALFTSIMHEFEGDLKQVPPVYSAIRIDGQRAHKMAREGKAVHLEARDICIESLQLVAFNFPLVSLDVTCSKGTYIRSLARDLGQRVGMGGCVTELRRTSTGGWSEAVMVSFDDLSEQKEQVVLPIKQWLRDFPCFQLDEQQAKRFVNGQRIQVDTTEKGLLMVFSDDMLLGMAESKPGLRKMVLHPWRILPSAQKYFLTL